MLTPEELAALDELGPEIVRMRLLESRTGPGASIPGFNVKGGCVTRSHIEEWLIEKNKETAALDRSRFLKTIVIALATLGAAAIAAWPVVEPWIRPAAPH